MRHLTILRSLNYAFAALYGIIGLTGLVGMVIVAATSGSDPVALFAAGLGSVIMVVVVGGLGVAHLVVGGRIGHGRGRVGQTVLAALSSGSFPLGLAYALYALWVCWVDEESKLQLA